MAKKYIKRYEELAKSNGYSEPLTYLFGRMKALQLKGEHDKAVQIALQLVPYGHGKIAPRDGDTGETVKPTVLILE